MLTKEEALKLVLAKLQRMSPPDDPFVIIEDYTIERPFGWVFFYNSKKFLETGIFRYRLLGNGPIIVNKATGTIESCGTGETTEETIENYEKKTREDSRLT